MELCHHRAMGGLLKCILETNSCSKKSRDLGITARTFVEIQLSRAREKDWQAEPGAGGEEHGDRQIVRPGQASCSDEAGGSCL